MSQRFDYVRRERCRDGGEDVRLLGPPEILRDTDLMKEKRFALGDTNNLRLFHKVFVRVSI